MTGPASSVTRQVPISRWILLSAAAVAATFLLAFPAPQAAAKGFAENFDHPRDILLRSIADLRVFVDVKPGAMPTSRIHGDLSAGEVREAVGLGIGNWASVMPQMRFRLVDSASEANLVLRFRDYQGHVPGGATAVAFLPSDWRPATPGAGAFDFACGAETFGRLPSGAPCSETSNNILMFQSRGAAFRKVHFLDSRAHQEYMDAKTDRSDTAKRFFRFLPDPRFRAWPPDRSTCVTGAPVKGVYPSWDAQCFSDADWRALPHFDRFGWVEGPYDLANIVGHEFGHTLLGGHTGEPDRCIQVSGNGYQDFGRDTVYREGEAIRLATWKTPGGGTATGYSVMFAGNGLDAAWNSRGIFEADAARLAAGSLDYDCSPTGSWKGYATSYPRALGWIVLQGPDGRTKYVDDWRYAQRLMGWPVNRGRPTASEWFQTGIIIDRR